MNKKKDILIFLGVIMAVIIIAFIQPGFTSEKHSVPVFHSSEEQTPEINKSQENVQVVLSDM